jgi:dTDP-L-rhamnose 4-epimerase
LSPLPAIEEQTLKPTSIYGITKLNQEQLLRQCAENYGIPAVSLRFQNVYGPHQALNNPYTGILAIFSTRIRTGNPIYIYEDGKESRDFVYVQDVVNALHYCLRNGRSGYSAYNVGSGEPLSVLRVAELLVRRFGKEVPLIISGKHRVGDIRHAWASIEKIRQDFGYVPGHSIEEGLQLFIDWVNTQPIPVDNYLKTEQELKSQGLLVTSSS